VKGLGSFRLDLLEHRKAGNKQIMEIEQAQQTVVKLATPTIAGRYSRRRVSVCVLPVLLCGLLARGQDSFTYPSGLQWVPFP
jgi:hypothetical protein